MWLLQRLQVCRSRGTVNCCFRKQKKMKMLQVKKKKRKQTMAPTGKVTPSGKWHNTETVEPECLQSQAVYLLCLTGSHFWDEKKRMKGFIPKHCIDLGKNISDVIFLFFFNIKVDIFFVKKKKKTQNKPKQKIIYWIYIMRFISEFYNHTRSYQFIRTGDKYLILEWNSSDIQ